MTKVIFRIYPDGDVIAILPELPGSNNPATCLSYMHTGQHGDCHPSQVCRDTRQAEPKDYALLKKELESIGYNLKIMRRVNRKDILKREITLES